MTAPEQDRQLVAQLLARKKHAWHEFVLRFQNLVAARVRKTIGQQSRFNEADVEDVVAEVFATLLANDLKSLRDFEFKSRLSTWLSIVAHRVCLRWVSRQKNRHNNSLEESNLQSRWKTGTSESLDRIIKSEDLGVLRSKLTELRDRDQAILTMFYLEELSYSEISKRMKISINSVGPKLNRAQRRLRDLMRAS